MRVGGLAAAVAGVLGLAAATALAVPRPATPGLAAADSPAGTALAGVVVRPGVIHVGQAHGPGPAR